jgi:hypothetical protein
MEKMIAFCGINCAACPAFIAYKTDDDELRKKTAEDWSKAFGTEIPSEAVNCVGCLAPSGVQISYCKECGIRRCASEKHVENCAHCDDYICEQLEKFHEKAVDAKKNLEEIQQHLK